MRSVHFTTETSSGGIRERDFTIGDVPGVLWSPATDFDRATLVLMGHGGGQDKRARGIVARARHFVSTGGFVVAAIDAPGHGDRPPTARDEQLITAMRRAQAASEPIGPIVVRCNTYWAERAVPEWQETLDALQSLPQIGEGPVGYWGVAMGTAIGVSLTAIEPRITAAVFGLLGPESLTDAARKVTVPVQFLAQSDEPDDPHSGTGLFDALASTDKALRTNPAAHYRGRPFELDSSTEFFLHHLSRTNAPRS
ncbi:alpha/beta hydrolase [Nocardia tengchongensis]